MTFTQLYGTHLDIELATADRTQLFTTARRKQAVNDGMNAFVRQTGCVKRYGSIALVDSTEEYNVYTTLTDWIRLAAAPSISITSGSTVRYYQGRDDFPRRDPEELDLLEPGWRASSDATPRGWYFRENGGTKLLGVYPPPDITGSDTWAWIVPYIAKPTVLSADGDVPFTISAAVSLQLEPYHQALVHYAAAQLEPLRKNYAAATRQMELYAAYITEYKTQQQHDGPDQVLLLKDYYRPHTRARDPRSWP
jgi:hypothetical protein